MFNRNVFRTTWIPNYSPRAAFKLQNHMDPKLFTPRCIQAAEPHRSQTIHPALHSPLREGSLCQRTERQEVEKPLGRQPTIEKFLRHHAGAPILISGTTAFESYNNVLQGADNVWAPFVSRIDYEVAKWAKLCGSGSTTFSELLAVEGLHDALGLSYQNTRELNQIIDRHLPCRRPRFKHEEIIVADEAFDCIKALYSDPEFLQHLNYAPERHYVDADKTIRMYHDIHTGKWWSSTQKELEAKKPGATVIPIILSSDKTQVTMFRNKSTYPVYMTIGNIPKEISWILLAYLPTSKLDHITNKATRCRTTTNLFHACLRHILEPLKVPGEDGVAMASEDGVVRRGHPIVACYSADYPEQLLTTGIKSGECPKCDVPHEELGSPDVPVQLRDLKAIIAALSLVDEDYDLWRRACQECGIKPVFKPFWLDLPHTNIFQSITPDVLHQLYQGIVKHLIDGTEHNQICRFLLGIVIGIQLPGNLNNARLTHAVRAILDFLYLAQYPCHTEQTLALLDDALTRFHNNKDIFLDLGIRSNFNLPEASWLPSLCTYDQNYTKHLHINLTKDAYRATNHKDEYSQMMLWLERQEKILWHNNFVRWRLVGDLAPQEKSPPDMDYFGPHCAGVQAPHFSQAALARYVVGRNHPGLSVAQLEREAAHIILPFDTVATFHRIKFNTINAHWDPGLESQVRVIFMLTNQASNVLFHAGPAKPPTHLAYVEWFTPFQQPELHHGLYKVGRLIHHGECLASVIDISDIRRSVHLIPNFGAVAPREWMSSTVLECCSTFFLNSFSDRHAYLTIV
ncbi:hypothetical protein F4604DRAFT_1879899 [Suillus subluteus]|nr:hypothetical protein F4604DRAFT_1879899 [Suillus subluteus]